MADEREAETAVPGQCREFKSEALRRGCDQHGIELAYRPPGRPHYGGIVERLIGTTMKQVHDSSRAPPFPTRASGAGMTPTGRRR